METFTKMYGEIDMCLLENREDGERKSRECTCESARMYSDVHVRHTRRLREKEAEKGVHMQTRMNIFGTAPGEINV